MTEQMKDITSEYSKGYMRGYNEAVDLCGRDYERLKDQLQEEKNAHSFWAKKSQELVNELKEADELLLKLINDQISIFDTKIEIRYWSKTTQRIIKYLAKKGYLIKVSERVYKVISK